MLELDAQRSTVAVIAHDLAWAKLVIACFRQNHPIAVHLRDLFVKRHAIEQVSHPHFYGRMSVFVNRQAFAHYHFFIQRKIVFNIN
jgi:hypothetical protein